MTVSKAKEIARNYYNISVPTEEDNFQFIEALNYLIEETGDPHRMLELGGWYYEERRFDLALKYYEMAAEYKLVDAYDCLGYIWYYGRTGEKDFEKAFKYYSLAAEGGITEAAYKVADMYKNGYYVDKDYEKYKSIIRDLYEKIKDEDRLFEPVPQIFIRMARILTEEGETEKAVELYWNAKYFLAQRLFYNPFFGDLNNMKWLIEELYKLIPFDEDDFDFYDMYYLLQSPCKITFKYGNKKHSVEAVEEDGECVICFDGTWYRTRDDFFKKAAIDNKVLTEIYDDLYLFEVV